MAEKTTEQVAKIFTNAGDSVTFINNVCAQEVITDEDKEGLSRNAKHLELIRGFTKEDNTTSIWGSEYDFSTHEAAITLAKSIYE